MIKKFSEMLNEDNTITFNEAFEIYIKGQTVVGEFSVPAYGNNDVPTEERYYG